LSVEDDAAAFGANHARDRAQCRALAGPVGANQRDDFARIDVHRHAVQRLDLSIADDQVLYRQQWRRAHAGSTTRARRGSSKECSALPRYASMTRWLDWTLAGVPSAIFLP